MCTTVCAGVSMSGMNSQSQPKVVPKTTLSSKVNFSSTFSTKHFRRASRLVQSRLSMRSVDVHNSLCWRINVWHEFAKSTQSRPKDDFEFQSQFFFYLFNKALSAGF